MQAHSITACHRHFPALLWAISLGILLLGGPETQSHVTATIDGGTATDSGEVANSHLNSWSQIPIESRELWKFRLTTRR